MVAHRKLACLVCAARKGSHVDLTATWLSLLFIKLSDVGTRTLPR